MKLLIYADDSGDADTVASAINGYLGTTDCKFRALPTSGYISIFQPTYDQIDDLRININNIVNLPCKFTATKAHEGIVEAYNEFLLNIETGSSFVGLSSHHGEDQLEWAAYCNEDTSITTVTGLQAQFARQMMCYAHADFKARTPAGTAVLGEYNGNGNTLVFDGDVGWVTNAGIPQPPTSEYTFRNARFVNAELAEGQTYAMTLRNFDKVIFKNCDFDLVNGMWCLDGSVNYIVLEDCTSYSASGYRNATWELRGCNGGRITNCSASGVVNNTGGGPSKYAVRISNQWGDVARTNPRGVDDGYRGQGQVYPDPIGRSFGPLTGNEVFQTFTFEDRRFVDRDPVEYSIDVSVFSGRQAGWVVEDNWFSDYNTSGLFAWYTDSLYHARNSGGNTRDGWFQYEWVRNIYVNGGDTVIDHASYVQSPTNTVIGLLFSQENTWITRQHSASALFHIGSNGSPQINVRYKYCYPRRFRFWHYSVGLYADNACWWTNDTLVQNCSAYHMDILNNGGNDVQNRPNVRILDNYFDNKGEPVASNWNYVGIRINNAIVTASGNVFADNGFFDFRAIADWNNAVPKSTITSYSNTNEGASGYTYYQSASKSDLPEPEAFSG